MPGQEGVGWSSATVDQDSVGRSGKQKVSGAQRPRTQASHRDGEGTQGQGQCRGPPRDGEGTQGNSDARALPQRRGRHTGQGRCWGPPTETGKAHGAGAMPGPSHSRPCTCRKTPAKSSSGPSTGTCVPARVLPWPGGGSGLLSGLGTSVLSVEKQERGLKTL